MAVSKKRKKRFIEDNDDAFEVIKKPKKKEGLRTNEEKQRSQTHPKTGA